MLCICICTEWTLQEDKGGLQLKEWKGETITN